MPGSHEILGAGERDEAAVVIHWGEEYREKVGVIRNVLVTR